MAIGQEVGLRPELPGLDGVAAVAAAEGREISRVRRLGQIRLAGEGVVVHVVRHDQHVVGPRRVRDHRGLGVGGARAGGDLLAHVVVDVQVEVVGGVLPPDRDRYAALGVVGPIPLGYRDVHIEAVADLVVRVVGGGRAALGTARRALGVDGALPADAPVCVVENGARSGRRERGPRRGAQHGDGQGGGEPRHGPGTVSESSHGTHLHSNQRCCVCRCLKSRRIVHVQA